MKLYELQEKEDNKRIIAFCYRPRSMAEISVALGLSLDHTRKEKVPILVAKGYLNKIKTSSGSVIYRKSEKIEL